MIENMSESQLNLRVFCDLIEDDVRHAGMMVSLNSAVCGVDSTTAPDVLYVSDAAAIDPGDDATPYTGASVTAPAGTTNLTAGSSITLTLSSLMMETTAPSRPAYDTDSNGVADSDFRVNGGVVVFDTATPTRGNACGRVTAVNIAAKQITVLGVAAMAAGAGTTLAAVPANEYRINGTQLLWNGIALADGIEDFQIGYVFDVNGNNVIDPGDLRGFAGATAYVSSALPGNQ